MAAKQKLTPEDVAERLRAIRSEADDEIQVAVIRGAKGAS